MVNPLKFRKRILIVDDEPLVRELLSETLKVGGYEVLIAAGGYEALEQAQTGQPDLILLDVMMPGLDGWKVLEKLRLNTRTRTIPVAMFTARGDTDSMMRAQELKVLDYFIKPINPEELLSFVRRYVELRPDEDRKL